MLLRIAILGAKIFIASGLVGSAIIIGLLFYYSRNLPDYEQLKNYYPPSVTRVYSADGKLMEEFAKEHRIFIPIDAMPKHLIQAFIAAEDKSFYSHDGIDIMSIIRAAITNIHALLNNRRIEGGSTITQQVVKNFLLTSERSIARKMKEAILSYMISKVFTKNEILELYLNQIYLGKGSYGVAIAALNYFNKSIEELTINECAVLASLPKAPSKHNPDKNYTKAISRRNYVLARMYQDGYLTEEEANKVMQEPITLAQYEGTEKLQADYYAAKVREEVINMFGEEYFYTAGLTIITCADSKLQQAAAQALRQGIREYDQKQKYRGSIKNISLEQWQMQLSAIPKYGLLPYKLAVLLKINNDHLSVGLEDGSKAMILLKDLQCISTKLEIVKNVLKIGDVIVVEQVGKNYFLRQIPEINGGIMVMQHKNGRVLAAEGGQNFMASKFDRVTQANRQPGSLIKPFVYMAALEKGAQPNDIFDDTPIVVKQGAGMPNWVPKNYEGNFLGPITLRAGLEKSRNTVTVRVSQFAGLNNVAQMISRFGINDNPSVLHSIVLGALETTLAKMVVAYGIIANGGKSVEPHFIELIKDRKGNVIYKRDYAECTECEMTAETETGQVLLPPVWNSQEQATVIDEATSYQMISLLTGCVQRGTARKAKHLKHNIVGKTGTTNKAKDAWFIGFTPQIVVGTYIGYDNPRSLGNKVSGATVALPVFINFMENGYKDVPATEFTVPSTIKLATIDYHTGKLSTAQGAIVEAFRQEDTIEKIIEKGIAIEEEQISKFTPDQALDDQDPKDIIQLLEEMQELDVQPASVQPASDVLQPQQEFDPFNKLPD